MNVGRSKAENARRHWSLGDLILSISIFFFLLLLSSRVKRLNVFCLHLLLPLETFSANPLSNKRKEEERVEVKGRLAENCKNRGEERGGARDFIRPGGGVY